MSVGMSSPAHEITNESATPALSLPGRHPLVAWAWSLLRLRFVGVAFGALSACVLMVIPAASWQRQVSALMGIEGPTTLGYLRTLGLAVVVAGLLVTVSRAVIDTIKLLAVTNAQGMPAGHSHNYGNVILDGWVAVIPPDGWTPTDTERMRTALNQSEAVGGPEY